MVDHRGFGVGIIVTLLIPFVGFVWNEVEKHNAERQRVIEDKRAESEIVIKLLPSLAGDPAAPARGIAMAVLSNMAQAGALREELKTAVDLAIKESDERARAGKATESERVGLTDNSLQAGPEGSEARRLALLLDADQLRR